MSPKSLIVLAACLAGLAGCSSVPSFGPERESFVRAANRSEPPFTLVEITPAVVDELSRFPILSLAGRFPDRRSSIEPTVGIGDALQVTVYEAASGGLFSNASTSTASPGAKTASVPPQVVANDGAISIPFGGRLRVVGLTIPQIEKAVVSRLEGKAIEPQAIVKLVLNVSGSVSVTGDAMNRAARVPLNVGGDRILDVIAQAGGATTPVNETYVDLIRGGVTARVPMQKVVAEPSENIYARPGDTIVVWLHPPTFTVLGATSANAVFPFDATGLSLQEAIGRSGGLKDSQADPEGVFVLRYEVRGLVGRFARVNAGDRDFVPIVYHINMRKPGSFALAQRFEIRDKDILFVANSPVTDFAKVIGLVSAVSSPVYSGVYTVKTISNSTTAVNTPYALLPGSSGASPSAASSGSGASSGGTSATTAAAPAR